MKITHLWLIPFGQDNGRAHLVTNELGWAKKLCTKMGVNRDLATLPSPNTKKCSICRRIERTLK